MLAEIHPRLPTLLERSAAWAGRRRSRLLAAVIALASIAAAAFGLVRFDGDVPLFDTALRPSQTEEIENALTLWGERFHADPKGTQIFVASARRRDILLRLTIAGLPRRYVPTSTDVLDDQANALTPESVIDDRRRSGIEGDLVTGLRRIAGVEDASVVLPPASGDPLEDPQRAGPPAAAVELIMQPGETLSPEAVAGVKRFVASAYPGLSADRVTVVDASGAAIGSYPSPDIAGAKERRVQSSVQSALDAVFGAGTAVVRVSVAAAGSQQRVQSTKIEPRGPISADVAHERGSDGAKSFDRERTVRRYAYDTVTEQRTTPADAPARMSIAVFLDSSRVAEASTAGIEALVRAAAGADLAAGDDVVVETLAFATPVPVPSPVVENDASRAGAVSAAVACAVALFGFASLPLVRVPVRAGAKDETPVREQHRPDDRFDHRAASVLASLEGESPQAAAYVLTSVPDDVRNAVLDRCAPSRREGITAYLDPRT